ncbi:MAG: hypothetical protein ACOYOB_15570 [Myxococcota bacterium]
MAAWHGIIASAIRTGSLGRGRHAQRLGVVGLWVAAAIGLTLALSQPTFAEPADPDADKAPAAEEAPGTDETDVPAAGETDEIPPEDTPTDTPTDPPADTPKKPSLLDEIDSGDKGGQAWDVPAAPAPPTYPFFEYHGYFRLRPDLISNGHLGMAVRSEKFDSRVLTTSAILPPLSLWPATRDGDFKDQIDAQANDVAGTNMRLRFAPTLHLSDSIRIAMTLDLFDNYLLGSSPDYAGALQRPDVPLLAFATGTRPGTVSVKEAYGEWKTLLGLIRFGRQSSTWGLGILANGGGGNGWDGARPVDTFGGARMPWEGSGYDADVGSYADRIAFVTKLGPLYASYFYDFVAEGLVGSDPSRIDGQNRDLEQRDDARQHGIALFSKPMSAQEIASRKTKLLDDNGSAFDYGVYLLYRTQELDLLGSTAPADLSAGDAGADGFIPRDAWAGIGDAWVRWESRPTFARRFVVEGEFAFIQGQINDANTVGGQAAKPKDMQMWGGALKAAFQNEGFGLTLDAGAASGDDTGCFGVVGDGTCSLDTVYGQPNVQVTAFKFHRNYRVDSLLFREVIGGVTNAWYAKPTVSINAYPFYVPQELGLDLSVLYAGAVDKLGTPGQGSSLGTELEAKGILGQRGLFQSSIAFSYLLPGDAFDLLKGWYGATEAKQPENTWRLLGNLTLMF